MPPLPARRPNIARIEQDFDCSLAGNCSAISKIKQSSTPQAAHGAPKTGIRGVSNGRPTWALGAGREQLAVQSCEGFGRPVVGAQAEDKLAPCADEPSGPVHQLLDHFLQETVLGRVTRRRVCPQQAPLADHVQDIHRHGCELAHQVVVVELACGQPGQVQVGLELGVKLLVRRGQSTARCRRC